MTFIRDNEYQDGSAVGALVGAFAIWQGLLTRNTHTKPHQLAFALVCTSESRALRVASFLHRNRACATTQVSRLQALPRADWRVQGATRREVQSLANLEGLFTWLRRAAHAHQVELANLRLPSPSQGHAA